MAGTLRDQIFAFFGHVLVFVVALFEGLAVEVVEVGRLVGAEEGPVLAGFHALHEQVGNPVRGVHVVGAAAVVAGVLAQLEEVLDVVVPGLEVGAAGAAALAALVDGDELVVVQLEERDDALALAIGALDVAAGAADGGPGSTEAAGPFGEVGVLGDAALHDGLDGVVDLVEVAGGELGVEGAGVEEGGRGGAEAAAFVEIVEADDPVFGVGLLGTEEAHGDAHPEELGRFETAWASCRLVDDEVAIVERLNAEVVEVEVGGGIERVGELSRSILEHVVDDAFDFDAAEEVRLKACGGAAELLDAVVDDVPVEDFLVDVGEENAAGELGEVSILLDEALGIEDDGLAEVFDSHLRENERRSSLSI